MIETRDLTKQYKTLTAVDGLNLRVSGGEIFGFIGPNGAGKTTTIRLLTTLLAPTSGSATVAGFDILREPAEVRRRIGYMPDTFGVYEDLKVWEYLDFFAAAYRLPPEKRSGVIDDVLALTDLTAKADAVVDSLSQGMKQRLCLAKTLVHDPDVLLLDEPASGLDPRARVELRELLKELRRMGKTLLVSSHILSELADFCTNVGIIERGRLVASGSVEEILRHLPTDRVVVVTVREEVERARDVLGAVPGVHDVQVEGGALRVRLGPECEDASVLAAALVGAGLRLTQLREEEMDLEAVFLRLTTGAVQ